MQSNPIFKAILSQNGLLNGKNEIFLSAFMIQGVPTTANLS